MGFGNSPPSRRLVVDTSAYSRLRVGHSTVLDWLARADAVLVPSVVLGELEAGFRIGRRYRENRRVLEEFLQEPSVGILDINQETAWTYGRIYAQLRANGTPVPANDMWIAAQVLGSGGHLVTFDNDFSRIENLEHTVLD